MMLYTQPWKKAWYDNGLDDRFFHDLQRTEKTATEQLLSPAQWQSRIMSETAQLAQHLTALEGTPPGNTQLKLAQERALKLAALAVHLAGGVGHALSGGAHSPNQHPEPPPATPKPITVSQSAESPIWPEAIGGLPPAEAPPHRRQTDAPTNGTPKTDPATLAELPPVDVLEKDLTEGASFAQHMMQHTQVSRPVFKPGSAQGNPSVEATEAPEPLPPPMRHTIHSLAEKGLSPHEIEVVTGQPSEVIQDVLRFMRSA